MHFLIVAFVLISLVLILGYALTTKSNRGIPDENRPNRVFHEEECPICLENKSYPVQASCAHEFCADCILKCLEKSSSCPMCRQKITILFKNFQECPDELKKRLKAYYGGADDRTYFEILKDAPLLLRRFFTHNDYQDFRTTICVIILIAAGIGYVLLPSDIIDESRFGWFGLIDDFGVLGGTLIYASILIFRATLHIALGA